MALFRCLLLVAGLASLGMAGPKAKRPAKARPQAERTTGKDLWGSFAAAAPGQALEAAARELQNVPTPAFKGWMKKAQANFGQVRADQRVAIVAAIRDRMGASALKGWLPGVKDVGCSLDALNGMNTIEEPDEALGRELIQHFAAAWVRCADTDPALRSPTAYFLLRYFKDDKEKYDAAWVKAVEGWARATSDKWLAHFLAVTGSPDAATAITPLIGSEPLLYLSLRMVKNDQARGLAEHGLSATEPVIRKYAALAVEGIGFDESCPPLVAALKAEKEEEPRRFMLSALGRLRCAGGRELAAASVASANPKLKAAAVNALIGFPEAANLPLVVPLLTDSNKDVQDAAAVSLQNQPVGADGAKLLDLLSLAERDPVRAKVLTYLAKTRTAAMADKLRVTADKAKDSDTLYDALMLFAADFPVLSLERVRALARQGNEANLAECLKSDTCQEVLVEAALALARVDDAASRDLLWKTLENAKGRQVQEALVVALVQLKEPRVKKQLALWEADANRRTRVRAAAQIILARELSGFELKTTSERVVERDTLFRELGRMEGKDETVETVRNIKVKYRVIGPGSKFPVLRINVRTEILPKDGKAHISLLGSNGQQRYLIDYMPYDLKVGDNVIEHPLDDLLSFEQRRRINLQVAVGDEVRTVKLDPMGSWIAVQLTDGVSAVTGSEALLVCGDRMVHSFTDLEGDALFEGIAPGTCNIDFPDTPGFQSSR